MLALGATLDRFEKLDFCERAPPATLILSSDIASAVADRVEEMIPRLIGVKVATGIGLGPNEEGTFDGTQIELSPLLGPTERLFNLLHLAGHTIQNIAPAIAAELEPLQSARLNFESTGDVKSAQFSIYMDALKEYEHSANRFGATLLVLAGGAGLLDWYGHYSAADFAMITAWHRSGQSRVGSVHSFRETEPWALAPRPLPDHLFPRLIERGVAIAAVDGSKELLTTTSAGF